MVAPKNLQFYKNMYYLEIFLESRYKLSEQTSAIDWLT